MNQKHLNIAYPGEDEAPYLDHFKGIFSSVFVAFNPFIQLPGRPYQQHGDWIPPTIKIEAKHCEMSCGVSWRDIARICGFSSVGHVNRALRLTGSKRIKLSLANQTDTEKLLTACKSNGIILPDEGRVSPVIEPAIGRFLMALGHKTVMEAGHFGVAPREVLVSSFLKPERTCRPEILSLDESVYLTMYTDYHYILVCQTKQSLENAKPSNYLEGFQAVDSTCDFWGIGSLNA